MIELMPSHECVDLVDDSGVIQAQAIPIVEASSSYPELHLQIAIAVVFDGMGRVLAQRRSQAKKFDRGHIDHVCGVVSSGEEPEIAARREGIEETSLEPQDITLISRGVNSYGRYAHLFAAATEELPDPTLLNPAEVEWVKFISPSKLKALEASGRLPFVGEFFSNLEDASSIQRLAA
jgi:8-oxo-dGTP pyrophosphatase MutT (NUDIX family)